MEDLLILGGFASLILFIFVYAIVATVKSCRAKKKARDEMNAEIMRKGREVQEARSKKLSNDLAKAKEYYSSVPPRGKETTKVYTSPTPTYVQSPTQSVKSDDGIDVLTGLMIYNALTSNDDNHRSSTLKSDDVTIKSDDGPSYKDTSPSYSDSSPSSSWSSSSSDSSSSWSSSDSYSSPSSDW
jgi:hypothetical protein